MSAESTCLNLRSERDGAMYPLKTVVISRDDNVLSEIRRELSIASAEVEGIFPDVPSALEAISQSHDERKLFVLHLDSIDDLIPLKHVSGVFAGRPILALFDENPSPSTLVRAMRQGVSQVVLLPFQSDDFQEALCSIETHFGHAVGKSQLIAVTAGHGGVGATTISVNLAYETAQQFQLDCILLELSYNVGVLGSYLDIQPKFTTRDLLELGGELDVYALRQALVPFADRFSVLAGPLHAFSDFTPSQADMLRLIQCARQLADVVVLDVPCTMDSMQLETLDAADLVVLVAEQTVPSIQMTCESLRLGMRAYHPLIVVNRFDSKLEGFDAAHLAQIVGTDHLRTVSDDHQAVHTSINSGQPLRLTAPHSPALADIDRLAEDLLGKQSSRKHSGGIFGRIADVLGIE